MDDAISRNAVHIIINSQIFDTEYPSELDELERQIDALPALDVAPVVHAKWLYDDEDDRKNVECSHCHMRWAVVSDDPDSDYLVLHITANELFFCPSCGARMDGESDA